MSNTHESSIAGQRAWRHRERHPDRYARAVFTGRLNRKYLLLAAAWIACALFFWTWWLRPEHVVEGPRYWLVTAALGWIYFLQIFFLTVVHKARVPAAAPPVPGTCRVAMIVTKTPSEPLSVVQATLEAMLAQDYPHDNWLADEDPQPDTVAWCAAHGVRISSRKDVAEYHRSEWPRRTRCKEGNLAYFYDRYGYDGYEFVIQLDADHVPCRTYLSEMLRGFADPAVGYVTAPSICSKNASQSWAARARLDTEAAFHGIFQSGYSAHLAPMCIGSHYAVRTRALRQIGGLGPELAEDHSTTMLMNAGGWRGLHALDAIAYGDGPANVADMCTQEFQWSRSLVTLLLKYTPAYLAKLPPRLKMQFLFCQLLYPIFAVFMLTVYFIPVAAVVFDIRYAEVTFLAFLLHSIPTAIAMTSMAVMLRNEGLFRPADAKVISWQKALFLCLQWPWVLFGCIMAVRDKLNGGFVDFRITPKGEAAVAQLPLRVVLPYAVLALGAVLPVLLFGDLVNAQGFYLLSLINAVIYAIIVGVILCCHIAENGVTSVGDLPGAAFKIALALSLVILIIIAVVLRGTEGLDALTIGLNPW
jgi:cellulose synthase (UDP-forming)